MTNKNYSVGILGGGITGLSAAYALSRKNIPVTVYERASKPGGAISTVQKNDWVVEEGPNTLMVNTAAHWKLFKDIGLGDDILEAGKSAKKRFIVKNGTPIPLPMGLSEFIKTPLLSPSAKFRLLKEPFAPPSAKHDESIATFIERRLGTEPLDYAVNPFVSGIYAGDPKKLSIKHTFSALWQMEQKHGSLLKGAFKRDRKNKKAKRALISFTHGIQQLAEALTDTINGELKLDATVQSVEKNEKGWIVKAAHPNTSIEDKHDCLISTLPTHSINNIFSGERFANLSSLPYAPMQLLALGFKTEQIDHPLDGFGMLTPEVEDLHFLGCLFSSSLFDERAPEGHHLLTCFIGGARQPEIAEKPVEEIKPQILKELNKLIGISGEPVFEHHRYWEKAIPQYEVGYDYFLSLMKEIEEKNEGLFLDGNFRGGVSVPDCISGGFETAQKAASFLKAQD